MWRYIDFGYLVDRDKYIEQLIKTELASYFWLNLNEATKKAWKRFIETNFNSNLSLLDILEIVINTLEFSTQDNYYIIRLSETAMTDFGYKVSTVARLINFGTFTIPGTNIISAAFDYVAANIPEIYRQELEEY